MTAQDVTKHSGQKGPFRNMPTILMKTSNFPIDKSGNTIEHL